MEFLVFIQNLSNLGDFINSSKILMSILFGLFILWGGARVFKEFMDGEADKAKEYLTGCVIGIIIFAIVASNSNNLANVLSGKDSWNLQTKQTLSPSYDISGVLRVMGISTIITVIVAGMAWFVNKKIKSPNISYEIKEDFKTGKFLVIREEVVIFRIFRWKVFSMTKLRQKEAECDTLEEAVDKKLEIEATKIQPK